jgi:hypothetical protein
VVDVIVSKFYKHSLKHIFISDSFPRILLIGDLKKMSVHTPPTLQKLAIQTLVREEALGMSDLEELAYGLFSALFKEAFDGRHIKLIKALVIAWPFHCLPVGGIDEDS